MTVFSRILAVVLAGMIGLPMCWCCPAMAAPLPQPHADKTQVTVSQTQNADADADTDEHACCHTDKQKHTGSDTNLPAHANHEHQNHSSKSCPCDSQMSSRELVSRDIVLPAPDVTPHLIQFWHPITLLMIPATPLVEVRAERTDDITLHAGLPPLYEQHCALLL